MSYLSKLRSRSQARKDRRILAHAIADAPSQSMRDELILAAQRSGISPLI